MSKEPTKGSNDVTRISDPERKKRVGDISGGGKLGSTAWNTTRIGGRRGGDGGGSGGAKA